MAPKKPTTKKTATPPAGGKKPAPKKPAAKRLAGGASARPDPKTRPARQRWRVGDVFQIDLPDGRYAYGRIYRDAAVGLYRTITEEPGRPPIGSTDFLFTVGMYRDVVTRGAVRVIGRDPFPSPEAEWPPPTYIRDVISGAYSLYHQGQITPSSKRSCAGLEEAAVWDYEHIVNRILAGGAADSWRGKP